MNIRDLPQPHSNMKIPSPGRFHQACLKAKLLAIAGLMMAANTAIAAPATSVVNTTGLAVTDNSVKVGILHSSTGTMAISETGSIQAEKLAIEQINAAGGVLGRKIEYVQEDGASDWPTFAEKARKLLVSDKVAAIFGGWTSASRKAPLPVLLKECRIYAKPRGYGISIFRSLVINYDISYDFTAIRSIIPHEIPHETSKKI